MRNNTLLTLKQRKYEQEVKQEAEKRRKVLFS